MTQGVERLPVEQAVRNILVAHGHRRSSIACEGLGGIGPEIDRTTDEIVRVLSLTYPAATGSVREAQDKRRAALIERLGAAADLACETPLPGDLGDVAYDLLREAAAQIASDRQHIAAAPTPDAAASENTCPFCTGVSEYQGSPEDAFCERHLRLYRKAGAA